MSEKKKKLYLTASRMSHLAITENIKTNDNLNKSQKPELCKKDKKEVSWVMTPEMELIQKKRKYIKAKTSKSCCIFHKYKGVNGEELSDSGKIADTIRKNEVPGFGWGG